MTFPCLYLMYLLQQIFFILSRGFEKFFSKSVSLPSVHRKENLFEDFYLFPLDNYYYSKYFFICKVQKMGKNLIIFVQKYY